MFVHRILFAKLLLVGLLGVGCNPTPDAQGFNELTIGVVSYDEGEISLERYEPLQQYLAEQTRSLVQLEPAYNEIQALEQIERRQWDIVFAPPGLASIAIDQNLYIPLFALEEIDSARRSLMIVRAESPAETLVDLNNKVIALGEPGSAAGYYLPIYDLYGLVFQEIQFAPTPRTALQWLSEGTVDASALSMGDFEQHRRDFPETEFRILHTSRWIPPGLVLLGPTVERNLQAEIERTLLDAPADIASDAGYVPTAEVPNYAQFNELVQKVFPLREQVRQTPAVLLYEEEAGG
ncbi:phosphate/phosphite/phosphonate ABC transporter substrate-binding protein [Egbenema bharatensis]|uniref:phosphate/phosphite/phosphonate ABC transporter substrate-binding protein n=1 Tax=Egbenema bharatensis TaxID=3463334 RepID=UPI003A8BFF8E